MSPANTVGAVEGKAAREYAKGHQAAVNEMRADRWTRETAEGFLAVCESPSSLPASVRDYAIGFDAAVREFAGRS